MKRVLICGEKSFVASGLIPKLEKAGLSVVTFSRSDGSVFELKDNVKLSGGFDAVINFILLKDCGVDENVRYAKALHEFCEAHDVTRLYQISSISVYPNDAEVVDEKSPIETDFEKKGVYAAPKVAVDNFLISQKKSYAVTFIRPGFVIEEGRAPSWAGIVKELPLVGGVLMGDQGSTLPTIRKETLHEAIVRLVKEAIPLDVCLALDMRGGTKANFAKKYYGRHVFKLPKRPVIWAAKALGALGVFGRRQVEMVKGLFKSTVFDVCESEYALGMSFGERTVAVIGSGAYGSYTVQRLMEMEQPPNVTLFEVGDSKVKNEKDIGYGTNLVGAAYTGLSSGRFFGFGGATSKWGGQLLMFTENDFAQPSEFMKGIVRLNDKFRAKVFRRFGFANAFVENWKGCDLFTKTGIWLGYFSRNLFKHFKVGGKDIQIRRQSRVVRFVYDRSTKRVSGLEFVRPDGSVKHARYDQYFLCSGAFEANRIIMSSGMVEHDRIHFSDHLSQNVFKIDGSTVVGGEDFCFGVQGTSLVTKRLIGEVDGISFFANPIYNIDFPFFQNLKEIMFKGKLRPSVIWAVIRDIPSCIAFAWSVFVLRKVYVYKNHWNVFIDIENKSEDSTIKLSQEMDAWGVPKLDVDFRVGPQSQHVYDSAREIVGRYLSENGVKYTPVVDHIHVEKSEDTYHPYGMFLSDSASVEDYFTKHENLLVVNTGILPRAGGINTTASCFPLIEEYVERYYGPRA